MIHRFRVVAFILLAFALLPVCLGLKVFPTTTELGMNYHQKQSFILTILNDGPRMEQVEVVIHPDSSYLSGYVTIEPAQFVLKSGAKQNIQITTNFPKNLSPERHTLIVLPVGTESDGETSMYTFQVPGVAKPKLKIDSVMFDDVSQDEALVLEVALNNLGNVIARALPKVTIKNESGVVGELAYERQIMIMPFQTFDISLLYDISNIPAGDYSVEVTFDYNDDLRTNEIVETLTVYGAGSKPVSSRFPWRYIVIGALACSMVIYLIFKPESLKNILPQKSSIPKEYRERFNRLDARLDASEKQLNDMVQLTQQFIEESNTWLHQKYGGKYNFK